MSGYAEAAGNAHTKNTQPQSGRQWVMRVISYLVAVAMMGSIYTTRHASEINWHYEMVHAQYLFRGWEQHWSSQMQTFTPDQLMLLGGMIVVFFCSGCSIMKS